MATSASAVAGSFTNVVTQKTNSVPRVAINAITRTITLAPVSRYSRKWPIVTVENTISATALPIEAIAVRSNPTTSTEAKAAMTSRPTGKRPTERPNTGGNCPIEARLRVIPMDG